MCPIAIREPPAEVCAASGSRTRSSQELVKAAKGVSKTLTGDDRLLDVLPSEEVVLSKSSWSRHSSFVNTSLNYIAPFNCLKTRRPGDETKNGRWWSTDGCRTDAPATQTGTGFQAPNLLSSLTHLPSGVNTMPEAKHRIDWSAAPFD